MKKPFPNPATIRDNKIRNRSQAYLRLLTFTREATSVTLLPKYQVRAQLWRANAARLAEILQRDFAADLANADLTLNCRLPWQPKPVRVRESRLDQYLA